jgi:hypothetical protein
MANVPELPAEWPLRTDQLAAITTSAHWQLEELSYLLMAGNASRERLDTVADGLVALAGLLRKHQPGDGH